MLICKYTRLHNAAFIPHLDILRAITMAIRRQNVAVDYSEGFNPHMKIFFGQPLPIGTESECEYFCVYTSASPQEFMQRLNASLPVGIQIKAAAYTEKDPNVANMMCFSDYTVKVRGEEQNLKRVEEYALRNECVIEYVAKGVNQKKNVKELIKSIEAENNRTIKLKLCCGNQNLRADRLMAQLVKEYSIRYGYDIVRTAVYNGNGENLDTILFGDSFLNKTV